MVVDDKTGKFVSQRNVPRLALVETMLPRELLTGQWGAAPPDAALHLTVPDQASLEIPLDANLLNASEPRDCTCWDWKGIALDQGDEAAEWLTSFLGRSVRLVQYAGTPDESSPSEDPQRRLVPQVNSPFAAGTELAFADFFPILLTSEGGLAALNAQLDEPVPMNRFRPNVVVDDPAPFPEDTWEAFSIAGSDGRPALRFGSAWPCARCKVTTTNQTTAEVGKEPLKKLYQVRSEKALKWTREKEWRGGAFFGWLCVPLNNGIIAVGDKLDSITHRSLAAMTAFGT
ncbi:hypothetical protein WJX74_002228 [Apatococcus lobatus]|uniref:MOSC domain-containing protein n=2 Tax=Apatococcus TaxID=904362 RepID=A0AAW1T660_9CHLO